MRYYELLHAEPHKCGTTNFYTPNRINAVLRTFTNFRSADNSLSDFYSFENPKSDFRNEKSHAETKNRKKNYILIFASLREIFMYKNKM